MDKKFSVNLISIVIVKLEFIDDVPGRQVELNDFSNK